MEVPSVLEILAFPYNTGYDKPRATNELDLFSRFDKPRLHDTTGCETGLTTGCIVYTKIQ